MDRDVMELNDTTDYQRCFACGAQNPFGLQMNFHLDGETIVCDFLPRAEHQGFPGVIHGGIIATILDETLNRTSFLLQQPAWTMTGRLEIRYRLSVPYSVPLRTRASLVSQRGRMMQAVGKITRADDETVVFAEASGTFMKVARGVLETVTQEYPGMRNRFE
jgi:acyl-coenzyme A thioesterase PaaI-like protein